MRASVRGSNERESTMAPSVNIYKLRSSVRLFNPPPRWTGRSFFLPPFFFSFFLFSYSTANHVKYDAINCCENFSRFRGGESAGESDARRGEFWNGCWFFLFFLLGTYGCKILTIEVKSDNYFGNLLLEARTRSCYDDS